MTNPRDGREVLAGRWQRFCGAIALAVLCAGMTPACGDDSSDFGDGGGDEAGADGGDAEASVTVDGNVTADADSGGDGSVEDASDGSTCAPGKQLCGATCLDTQVDIANCGGCGLTCTAANGTPVCVAGVCGVGTCNAGFADCDHKANNGCEVNTTTDPTQCGMCGNACNPANGVPACVSGACTIATCNGGFADCDKNPANGCEINVGTDPLQCGACGAVCSTANGVPSCAGGKCTLLSCSPGFADCDNAVANGCEVNTAVDPLQCGACGHVCAEANATAGCAKGACTVATCNAGFSDCNKSAADGCEVNTNTTVTNCGACGNVCTAANGAAGCAVGKCTVASCSAGFADCDNSPANGCEVNTNTTPTSCGACGTVCAVANATAGCAAGKCTVGTCNAGFADCDGDPANGCEVNILTTPASCGACGNVCAVANAVAGCAAGKCTVGTCKAGFSDCDGNPANGCEVDTNTTVSSCGTCGNVCAVANGTPACAGGACTVASCNPGFADCDANAATGCEVNINTTPSSCGACGTVCAIANGTAGCAAGKCTVGACNAGFADCDGNPANGCEINLNATPTSCGTCGHVCAVANGSAGCAAGVCTVATCNAGFADCDGNPANGCEVNTSTTPTSCGTCGHVCTAANGTAGCAAGACTVASCSANFADCNGNPADGCEINKLSDATNCGACGNVCVAANGAGACAAGACVVAGCNAGFADCNGNPVDGCEINTTTDNANCGGCGASCINTCGGAGAFVSATTCAASACKVTTCQGGHADNDLVCSNGCECTNSTVPTTCAAAQNLGTLNLGQTLAPLSSNLFPDAGAAAYFTLTFTGNTSTTYQPTISLTDPLGEFVMDILSTCAGPAQACGVEGGTSTGVTMWSEGFTGAPSGNVNPMPPVGNGGNVIIKVYRKVALTNCSNQFTLTAHN